MPFMGSELSQESRIEWLPEDFARYLSIAVLVKNGPRTSSIAFITMAVRATVTCQE